MQLEEAIGETHVTIGADDAHGHGLGARARRHDPVPGGGEARVDTQYEHVFCHGGNCTCCCRHRTGSASDDFGEYLVRDVEVGVDRLDVVDVLERIDQPQHLWRRCCIDGNRGRWELGHVG